MLHLKEQLPVEFAVLPDWLFEVTYDYTRIPGQILTEENPRANCQLFAYTVLEALGRPVPPHRSSELWEDTETLDTITDSPQMLDLVLYAPTEDPYGAHVGIWVDEYRILHLCAEEKRPTIWSSTLFATRKRYAVRLGWKRVQVTQVAT